MDDKAKEQLLRELSIKKYQMLISNNSLFSQVIDFLPYPIAVFTPEHVLTIVNKAFEAETKTRFMYPKKESVRILQYKISDIELAAAINQVFAGDIFFLENLKSPFSMFSHISQQSIPQSDRIKKAVIFPVPADDAVITHGVIVFMP